MLVKTLSIIMLAQFVPLNCQATDIRQRPYRYTFDAVVAREDEQFIVCTNCPDDRLSKTPLPPKLALRLTASENSAVPASNEERGTQHNRQESPQSPTRTETVRFDFNSSQLSRNERKRLDQLIENLPSAGAWDVQGYTCSLGSSNYNEKLSLRRANHVAGVLRANGLKVGTVIGKGECCPVSTEKRLNRRVEILEHRKEDM